MIDNRIGNIARGAGRGPTARVGHLLLLVSLGAAIPAAAQDGVYDAMIQGATDNQLTIANGIINADRMRKATARHNARHGQSIDMGVTPAMDPSAIAHGILVSNIPRNSASTEPTDRSGAPRARASGSAVSTYRESAAVRTQIADTMAEVSEQRSPGSGEEMRRMVTSGAAMAQYRKVAASYGFRPNDAVDALAFYLIVQWGVANDHRPDITRAQISGVRNQVRSAFPSIAGQLDSDAKRQNFAETLAIQGTIMAGVHEAAVAANASDRLAEYSAMARKGGTPLFGADPTEFELTDQGIVPRGD